MQGIADALARIVSGCFVLTLPERAGSGGGAILLSFVQQVGFEPPRVIVAIRKGRPTIDDVDAAGCFVVNVCAEDRLLLRQFAGGARSADPFSGSQTQARPEGAILREACAWLACRLAAKIDGGDHWIYLADVTDGGSDPNRSVYVHVRKSGLSY